jgi:hypothetical protein
MKRVSADSCCSVVWCGARAACAEVSTGSLGASKAKHGHGLHMEPSIYGRLILIIIQQTNITEIGHQCQKRYIMYQTLNSRARAGPIASLHRPLDSTVLPYAERRDKESCTTALAGAAATMPSQAANSGEPAGRQAASAVCWEKALWRAVRCANPRGWSAILCRA